MVEYALLLALIVVTSIGVVLSVGNTTSGQFDTVAASLTTSDGSQASQSAGQSGNNGGNNNPTTTTTTTTISNNNGGNNNPTTTTTISNNNGGNNNPTTTTTVANNNGNGSGNGTSSSSTTTTTTVANNGNGNGGGEQAQGPGSSVDSTDTSAGFYWWNDTKKGGEGAWKGSSSYSNDYNRHQYLTLEVTRTMADGSTETETVNSFYIPANGTADYTVWNNELSTNKKGKVKSGVVSIEITVTKIKTSDENWNDVTYDTTGPITTIEAPEAP